MSALLEAEGRWNRQRWLLTVGGVMLVQLLAIVVLSGRQGPAMLQPRTVPPIRLLDGAAFERGAGRALGLADPTLLALPDARGFAGVAWQRTPDVTHPSAEWNEPPRWLAPDTNWFATGVPADLGAGGRVVRPVGDKPRAQLQTVRPAPLPLAGRSRLELDPGLAARGIVAGPDVPSLAHSTLLAATELQVAVDPDGAVFSAVVVQSSGWRPADERALVLVQQLRFRPAQTRAGAAAGTRDWGRIRFRWHTLEAAPAAGGGAGGTP